MRDIEDEDFDGDKEDIYTEEGREMAEEDDEITAEEAGFMEGYEEGERLAKCQTCHKVLPDEVDEVVEEEYNGETYRFCSQRCVDIFKSRTCKFLRCILP